MVADYVFVIYNVTFCLIFFLFSLAKAVDGYVKPEIKQVVKVE